VVHKGGFGERFDGVGQWSRGTGSVVKGMGGGISWKGNELKSQKKTPLDKLFGNGSLLHGGSRGSAFA